MKQFFIAFAFSIVAIIGALPAKNSLQTITFYTTEDYKGESETFSKNVADIQDSTEIARIAKSLCVEKGVWVISYNFTPGYGAGWEEVSMTVNSNLGELCTSLHNEETGQRASFTKIKHLGANDMTHSSLALFEEKFKGEELFLQGEILTLPRSIAIKSYAVTANIAWTVTLSSGEDYCLPMGGLASDPYLMGLSFAHMFEAIEITVIKKGCDESIRNLPGVEQVDVGVIHQTSFKAVT